MTTQPESPYDSSWASSILRDRFKVSLKAIQRRNGNTKWVVKRLKEDNPEI